MGTPTFTGSEKKQLLNQKEIDKYQTETRYDKHTQIEAVRCILTHLEKAIVTPQFVEERVLAQKSLEKQRTQILDLGELFNAVAKDDQI